MSKENIGKDNLSLLIFQVVLVAEYVLEIWFLSALACLCCRSVISVLRVSTTTTATITFYSPHFCIRFKLSKKKDII